MKKPIEESEAHMEAEIDVKIQAVHWRIDVFELKMMERPQPRATMEMTTFQSDFAKLWDDIDALAAPEVDVLEFAPEEDVGDVVLSVLFSEDTPSLDPPPPVAGKQTHTSEPTTDREEARWARKKER
uniref:Integrase core domain containing protein n=1 Tax=Solanum tuberosum TaxID=4113 RepID=M1DNB6_SOLTU